MGYASSSRSIRGTLFFFIIIILNNMSVEHYFKEQPFSSEDKRNYPQICLEIQLKRKTGTNLHFL